MEQGRQARLGNETGIRGMGGRYLVPPILVALKQQQVNMPVVPCPMAWSPCPGVHLCGWVALQALLGQLPQQLVLASQRRPRLGTCAAAERAGEGADFEQLIAPSCFAGTIGCFELEPSPRGSSAYSPMSTCYRRHC